MMLRPGDTFAGCRILAMCGSGGTGVVYLAQDTLERSVALKIVPLCDFQRELAGIRRYIQTAAGQPNLIQIYHAGIEQDCLYYTMEAADNLNGTGPYVPKTLSAVLARAGTMQPREALELIRKLADGLQVLHHDDLIHRDIKPENIIYVHGIPKLCDPGLVCELDATVSLVGTLGYLPPECFNGLNLNTRGRDIYALGKVFYAAVTGEPPARYPHIPSDFSLSVRRKIWPLLTRVCNSDPKHRFQKIEDFRRALPSELPNPGRLERMLNSFRQWRLANPGIMTAFFLIILLSLTLGFAAGVWHVHKQRRHAAFLEDCRKQCETISARYPKQKNLLFDQLAGLAGEAEAKKIGRTLHTLPDDPAARLKIYRQLDSRLGKLVRSSLAEIPEKASIPEIRRISDRNRGLLASPLGAWLTDAEWKTLMRKLAALEKQAFPDDSELHPGCPFRSDSSFRCQFNYVPAGSFHRKDGTLIRIPYGFWCCDGELRTDNFLPAMGWMKSAEQPGMPMVRFCWNDLLEYCRIITMDAQQRGQIPAGYIFRPLTAAEWQWACRGAWSGADEATAFLKGNSGGRAHLVRSGKPNGLGLYDFLGNVAEIVIPDSGIQPEQPWAAFCGGWYDSGKADPEKCTPYLKYQWLPPFIGSRIAIVPGSMEFFDRALWVTAPRETVIQGRHYELLAANATNMTKEKARIFCRLLGGRLLVPESDEQLKALRKVFSETGTFPVSIDGGLKNGSWFRPDGRPYTGVTLPAIPKNPVWSFSFHRGKIRCYPGKKTCGFICEWDETEYRRRNDPERIRKSGVFLHTFQIGSTRYLLVPGPVYSHTARRIAQLLGTELAQPRTKEIRERLVRELEKWKEMPIMLGGHWKYRNWVLADGSSPDLELPLRGLYYLESLNLASPGLLDGQFCALQSAQAFLLELPLE